MIVVSSNAPRWVEISEELAHRLMNSQLLKGAGHKYIRRVPTGKKSPKYRYYYNVTGSGGMANDAEIKVGAAFKHEGGHYHITGKAENGEWIIKHDETGDIQQVSKLSLRWMLHAQHRSEIGKKRLRLEDEINDAYLWGTDKQLARLKGEAAKLAKTFSVFRGMVSKDIPRPEIRKKEPRELRTNIRAHDAATILNRLAGWVLEKDVDDWIDQKGLLAEKVPTNIKAAASALADFMTQEWGVDWEKDDHFTAYRGAKPKLKQLAAWTGISSVTHDWEGFFYTLKALKAGEGLPGRRQGAVDLPTEQIHKLAAVCRQIQMMTSGKISRDMLAVDEYEDLDAATALVKAELIEKSRRAYYGDKKGSRKALVWLVEQLGKIKTKRGVKALERLMDLESVTALPIKDAKQLVNSWDIGTIGGRMERALKRLQQQYGDLKVVHNQPDAELDGALDRAIIAAKDRPLAGTVDSDLYEIDTALHDKIGVGHHAMWTRAGNAVVQEYFQKTAGCQVNLVDRTFINFMTPKFRAGRKAKEIGVDPEEDRKQIEHSFLLGQLRVANDLAGISFHDDEATRKRKAVNYAARIVHSKDRAQAKKWLNMAYERFGQYGFSAGASASEKRAANEMREAAQQSLDAQRRVLRDINSALKDFSDVVGADIDLSGLPIKVDQRTVSSGANAHYSTATDPKQLRRESLSDPDRGYGPHIALGEDRLEKSLAHEAAHYLDNRMSMRGLARPAVIRGVVMGKLKEAWGPTTDWPPALTAMHKRFLEAFGRQSSEHGLSAENYASNLCAMVSYLEAHYQGTVAGAEQVATPDAVWSDFPLDGKMFVATLREAITDQPGGKEYMGLFDAIRQAGVLRQFEKADEKDAGAAKSQFGEHGKYFSSGEEMLARAVEQWVHMKLAEKGRVNPSLTHMEYTGAGGYSADWYVKDADVFKKTVAPAVEAFMGMVTKNMTKAMTAVTWFQGLLDSLDPDPVIKAEQLGFGFGGDEPAKPKQKITVSGRTGKPKKIGSGKPPVSAWQPVPGSKIPGAQRQRRGGKYIYRYPAKGGGWTSSPGQAQKPAKKPPKEPPAGKPKEWVMTRDGRGPFELVHAGFDPDVATLRDPKTGKTFKAHGDDLRPGAAPGEPVPEWPPKPKPKESKPSEPGWERMTGREKFDSLKARAKAVGMELTFTGAAYKLGAKGGGQEYPTLEAAREVVAGKESVGQPVKVQEGTKEPGEPIPPPPPPKPVVPRKKLEPKKKPKAGTERQFTDYGGLIEGSRLELSKMTREDMDANPVLARKLVTKANVFGDYKAGAELDKAAGVSPGAARMKREVLEAVAQRPGVIKNNAELEAELRHFYRDGATQLMNGLARCQTVDDVQDFLREWQDATEGKTPKGEPFTPEPGLVQPKDLAVFSKDRKAVFTHKGERLTPDSDPKLLHAAWLAADRLGGVRNVATPEGHYSYLSARSAFGSFLGVKGFSSQPDGKIQLQGQHEKAGYYKLHTIALGKAFARIVGHDVVRRRGQPALVMARSRGGYAQQDLVTLGKDTTDWSWTGQEKEKAPKKAPAEKKVVDKGDKRWVWVRSTGAALRKGPKIAPPKDSADFAKSFGFPQVNYGSWANDAEREWHVVSCHEALHDLAGVLGVNPKLLGINGRLKIAFGARGTGGKRAPAAHYEPGGQVINLTKLTGAGSLAHEWGHFLDNAVMLGTEGMRGSKANHISEQMTGRSDSTKDVDRLVSRGVPRDIAQAARDVMTTIKVKPETRDEKLDRIERVTEQRRELKDQLKVARKSSDYWYRKFDAMHGPKYESGYSVRNQELADAWRTQKNQIKAAWFSKNPDRIGEGGYGFSEANLAHDAKTGKIDISGVTAEQLADYGKLRDRQRKVAELVEAYNGTLGKDAWDMPTAHLAEAEAAAGGKYYSTDAELFARAFESYVEDQLHQKGQANTYLVAGTREMHVSGGDRLAIRAPEPGIYIDPKDDHRARCNAAFDKLLSALKKHDQFTKALAARWTQLVDQLEDQLGR